MSERTAAEPEGAVEHTVFISYAHVDRKFAEQLADDLEAQRVGIWIDRKLLPGRAWDEQIMQAIKTATVVLVVLSPEAARSPNVADEFAFAIEDGDLVVPILYRECEVPFRLKRLQYIDFREPYADALARLVSRLREPRSTTVQPHAVSAHAAEPAPAAQRPLRRLLPLGVAAAALGALAWYGVRPSPPGAAAGGPGGHSAATPSHSAPPSLPAAASMGQALIDQYSSLVDSRSRWLANKAPWLSAAEDFERALAAGQVAPEREKRVRSEEAFARGRYAALSGDLAQAESQLRAATELDRAWAPPYLELASLLTRLGRFDEAHGMARHALQVEPGLWLTAVCEGPIYAAEGKPFDAVGVYESAQARFALPLVQGNLALAYHATGQNDASAERLARQALERDPDLPPALIVLADRALERGNAAEALSHTQRLVDTALFDVTAWLLHGDALLGSKQNALARQAYERAVELYEKTRQTGAPPQRLAIVRAALARGELPPPRGDATGPEGRPHPAAPRDRPRPAAGGAGRGISARDLGFGL